MILSILLALAAPVAPAASAVPPPADPRTAKVQTQDAERFARLFARTGGKPTAADIQREYLDGGSYGVSVFTPNRIVSAERMAQVIAQRPEDYARAIERCLPLLKHADRDLRAIYRALHRLLPDRPLPQIYIVFGAGTSGGTAGPGGQVLGLEVLCKVTDADPAKVRDILRQFFAHETVHTWQAGDRNGLADAVLAEGAADFIAARVTGRQPDPARATWAAGREAELWRQLQDDVALLGDRPLRSVAPGDPGFAARMRWVANYRNAPAGWPYEVGYWMGQQVWQRFYDRAPDKRAALDTMLGRYDARAILRDHPPR